MESRSAIDYYRRAMALAGTEDRWGVREARALAGEGEAHYWLADYRTARNMLERARPSAPSWTTPGRRPRPPVPGRHRHQRRGRPRRAEELLDVRWRGGGRSATRGSSSGRSCSPAGCPGRGTGRRGGDDLAEGARSRRSRGRMVAGARPQLAVDQPDRRTRRERQRAEDGNQEALGAQRRGERPGREDRRPVQHRDDDRPARSGPGRARSVRRGLGRFERAIAMFDELGARWESPTQPGRTRDRATRVRAAG